MKRAIVGLLIVIIAIPALWLVAGLVARGLVSGSSSNGLISSLETSLGVSVSVGAAEFDLAQWFLLTPAISLENVVIGNPPGFHGKNLLEARKLSAQVALLPLLHKSIEVRSVVLDQPRILVESNAHGVTNLEALLRKPKANAAVSRPANSNAAPTGVVIDEVSITNGEITGDSVEMNGIDLRLRDLSSDRACRLELGASFFRGKNTRLRLEAHVGPFTPDSLPLDGTLTVTIAPGEMPPAFRRRQFGTLLVEPGDKARAKFTASIKGDVYRTMRGPAKVEISDMLIGKDEKHVLPLAGEAPLTFTAAKLISVPDIQLNIAGAKLRLGKGEWTGGAALQLRGSASSGNSSGNIRNVEINEMVSATTSASDKIYGTLEVPSYTLQFAGRNADEIRNSLHGSAKLSVTQGRIAALDLLSSIQQGIANPQQALAGKKGATPFSTLAAEINIGESKINMEGLALDSPALRVTGRGVMDFDQNLNFDLAAQFPGAAQLMSRVSGPGKDGGVPLKVTGTVNAPQVRPNAGKMVQNAVGGLLDSFFKKKP